MPLPDFLIIGAMKAGTTSIHENLKSHPKIGMSDFKETNYFTSNYNYGINWYKSLFNKSGVKNGEACPSYAMVFKYPDTAERIYKTTSKIKLIYILRDPVDRIVSHLHHNLYRDRFNKKNVDL